MSNNEDKRQVHAVEIVKKIGDQNVGQVMPGASHSNGNPPQKTNYFQYVLIFIGCAVGIVISQILINQIWWPPKPPVPGTIGVPAPYDPGKMPDAVKMSQPHLAWAEKECDNAAEQHILILKDLFVESKKRTRNYADDALGWYSKWLLIKDIPFTSKQHGPYLKSEFEKKVLDPKAIDITLKKIVELQIKSIKDVESQFMVKIQQDSANYPNINNITKFDSDTIKVLFEEAIKEAAGSATGDVAADIGKMIGGQVASAIAVSVAMAIGAKMVSTGVIAGVAVPSSGYTLGASIVVGIVLDQFISWVWDWYANPKGDLTKKLNNTLDQMSEAAIEGAGGNPGLRKKLMELNSNRASLRRTATLKILTQ